MTIKQLIISLKYGANARFIMQKYGFESEDELFQTIKKMTTSGADELIRQLKRNDKRTAKFAETVVDAEAEANIEVDAGVNTEADTEADTEVDTEVDSEVDDELSLLEQDEQEISNLLCTLEGKHKDLVCERRQITSSVREIEERFDCIIKEIEQMSEASTAFMSQFYALGNQMRTLNQEISDYRALLGDVRARMEELKQVFILVSSDGIEIENAETPFVRQEEIQAKFDALMHHEAAEELTVREIKTVAKLLLMVGAFEKYEVMFDNSRMETFFEQVKTFLVSA